MWEQDEDYYGGNSYAPSYTPYSGRTSYKGGRSTWSRSSWSSYSFSTVFEDDDRDLMVKDPVSYITPTKIEIKRKVRVFKQEGVDLIKELSRVCYFKMLDEKDYLPEHLSDWDNLDDDTKAQHSSKKELFDSIYEKYIPGFTPLEQAIAIFLELQRQDVNEDGDRREDDDPKLTPSFGFNREMYNDPTINEQLNYNELSKDKKMDIMNKISIIGDLGTQFKVEKEVDEKIVSNSDQFSKKIMRDYSQITMIDLYQRVFPNYRTKLATKDLMVNVPVERKEQKQKIIIMLDYSGSMDEEQKQIWVNAILIDRFRYVMKGEAEVFFSYFVSDVDRLHFHHITNREDVIAFWQMFSNSPNGGTTRVGSMVDHVAKEILTHKKLHNLNVDLSEEKPEILIINDGQDSIDSDKFPYKVNAICLFEQNEQLKKLCTETDGKQVNVEEGNVVKAYSKTGGEQIISK
jgi:hypothetical protein